MMYILDLWQIPIYSIYLIWNFCLQHNFLRIYNFSHVKSNFSFLLSSFIINDSHVFGQTTIKPFFEWDLMIYLSFHIEIILKWHFPIVFSAMYKLSYFIIHTTRMHVHIVMQFLVGSSLREYERVKVKQQIIPVKLPH